MSIQHFKKLREIAREDGIRTALNYDLAMTMKRHPNLAGLALYASTIFSKPNPEPEVYITEDLGKRDGYTLQRRSWVPVSVAHRNGLISPENYQAIMRAQR